MKKILIFLIVVGALISCNKTGSLIYQVSFALDLVNNEGISIFELPNTDYSHDNVRLYYYDSNKEYTLVFDQNLIFPYGFRSNPGGVLEVQPVFGPLDGDYIPGGKSTTYIDFGNGDIDTIQVAGEYHESGSKIVREIWYNGIKKNDTDAVFIFIKE